ncbi:hypothetical protein PTTG_07154 [Puccinia triticina 1-1 BBBD Race 1]|uniref:Uncharacterized protein n=1 Tax=Puccinia triticina (isolate 1-1 / race 1 (BBBD)) TaxID=630390 RepID=A0A180GFX2_PUCT1|nr:hypothetical protein PTTG_07154 [Puccinia triticina 1-1 BBBD Race 1]
MVTTRNAAYTAATSIVAARALRQQRRARTAEEEILGLPRAGPPKPNRRQRRSTSAKATEPPVPAPAEEHEQMHQDPGQQDNTVVEMQPPPAPQASVSSAASHATVRPAHSNDQPQAVDHAPRPQSQRPWWGPIRNAPVPNSPASISKPTESLFQFASGVPTTKPESKPLEAGGQVPELNAFPGLAGLPPRDSTYTAQRQQMITKAATAVMAHMNGQDVSRSDYVDILEGMLVDPEMRTRLPPVLVEQYDAAAQGERPTLYNGGLIERFIHATKRATDVTARIMMTNKNARRERRARKSRNRPSPSPYETPIPTPHMAEPLDLTPPAMAGPSRDEREDSRNEFLNHQQAQAPMAARPSRPLIFSQPLTEANLHRRAQIVPNKGKARETSGLCEEERSGVVRTAKGAVRAAPYPRRASGETRAQSLAAEVAHFEPTPDESRYSVYSASTGQQQSDAQRMGGSVKDGIKRMHEPNTAEWEYVQHARQNMEEIRSTKGPRWQPKCTQATFCSVTT